MQVGDRVKLVPGFSHYLKDVVWVVDVAPTDGGIVGIRREDRKGTPRFAWTSDLVPAP